MSLGDRMRRYFKLMAKAKATADRLPDLMLEARNLSSLILGLRNKSKAGPGLDFHKYRDFENGVDSPQRIDWKASARRIDHEGNDRLLIRDREVQVTQKIYIVREMSPEVENYAEPRDLYPDAPKYTRAETRDLLAFTIAYQALDSSEYFALMGTDLPLSGNKTGIEQMLVAMQNQQVKDYLPAQPVHRGKTLGANSHVYFLGSFFRPVEEIKAMLDKFHHAGVKCHMVQILTLPEVDPRYKGRIKLSAMDGQNAFIVDQGREINDKIRERILAHSQEIEALFKKMPGSKFSRFVTGRPPHEALLPHYGIETHSHKKGLALSKTGGSVTPG